MIRMNLLPVRELKKQAQLRQQLYMFGAITAVMVLGIAALWWMDRQTISRLEVEKAHLESELGRLKQIVDDVNAMEKRQKLLNARLETIQRLRRNQRGPVLVLDELSRNLPEQAWIETIDETGGVYKVAGYALTNFAVADLLRNLQRSQQFTNVDLISSEQAVVATQQIKKFSLQFQRSDSPSQPAATSSTAPRKPGA
jgi:type IV pilus assembly protein PilN